MSQESDQINLNNKETLKHIQECSKAISHILETFANHTDLVEAISNHENEPDSYFGKACLNLLKQVYPEYERYLDDEIATSVGRCICQIITINKTEAEQLDDRFEVDYLKRTLVVFENKKDPVELRDAMMLLLRQAQDDIRFPKPGINLFKRLYDSFNGLDTIQERYVDGKDVMAEECQQIVTKYTSIVNTRLTAIDEHNQSSHWTHEVPVIDYAQRYKNAWSVYRDKWLGDNPDPKAFTDVIDFCRFSRDFTKVLVDSVNDTRWNKTNMGSLYQLNSRIIQMLDGILKNVFIMITSHKNDPDNKSDVEIISGEFTKFERQLNEIVMCFTQSKEA